MREHTCTVKVNKFHSRINFPNYGMRKTHKLKYIVSVCMEMSLYIGSSGELMLASYRVNPTLGAQSYSFAAHSSSLIVHLLVIRVRVITVTIVS